MARLERANAGVKVLCLTTWRHPKVEKTRRTGSYSRSPDQWGGIRGSNPRHPEPQSGALPTELIPPYTFLLLRRQLLYPAELLAHIQEPSENGAGEGNRTLVPSLEGWYSTIELHPQAMRAYHYPRRMSRVPERKTLKIRRGMGKFLSDQP